MLSIQITIAMGLLFVFLMYATFRAQRARKGTGHEVGNKKADAQEKWA